MKTIFEIGKYYNFSHINGNNWIVKITDIKNMGHIVGFFLTTNKFCDSWTILHHIDVNTIRKATPEEIQRLDACISAGKFIPKQTVPIFESGKYYYVTTCNHYEWIIKYDHTANNLIFANSVIDIKRKSYTPKHCLCHVLDINEYREANLDEIEWLNRWTYNNQYSSMGYFMKPQSTKNFEPNLHTCSNISLGEQIPDNWAVSAKSSENLCVKYDDLIIPKIFDIPKI
jgi:hypothetical protein